MVNIKTVLSNFVNMLKTRGINPEYYQELLRLSNPELELFLYQEHQKLQESKPTTTLDKLKRLGNSYETVLTEIIPTDINVNVLVYWNTFDGKTVTTSEIASVTSKVDNHYIFYISLYDKIPSSMFSLDNVEFFNFTDFLFNPNQNLYYPEESTLYEHQDFIELNPLLERYRRDNKLPKIQLNDPQARYLGAKPGNIILSKKRVLVPESFLSHELSFREVIPMVDLSRNDPSGIWYNDY